MACRERKLLFVLAAVLAVLRVVRTAPGRGKGSKSQGQPATVFDQKQTGDYNIQLHLKDFQIIALLADDSVGFGDYDYSYDYSDFTIKPSTSKPSEPSVTTPQQQPPSSSSTSTPSRPSVSTFRPLSSPSSVQPPPASSQNPTNYVTPTSTNSDVEKEQPSFPSFLSNETSSKNPLEGGDVSKEQEPAKEGTSSTSPIPTKESESNDVVSKPATQRTSDEVNFGPGKIKVQIIQAPVEQDAGAVPGEEDTVSIENENEGLPQGEMVHMRKCGQPGYARDKKGRCRRVRKPTRVQGTMQPHLTFGLGRLASNLASKFRHTTHDSPSSESAED